MKNQIPSFVFTSSRMSLTERFICRVLVLKYSFLLHENFKCFVQMIRIFLGLMEMSSVGLGDHHDQKRVTA